MITPTSGVLTPAPIEKFIESQTETRQPRAESGPLQVWVDLTDMTFGDQYRIRIYESPIRSAPQRTVLDVILDGPQTTLWVSPILYVENGWSVGIQRLSGRDIQVRWSIRSPGATATQTPSELPVG